MLTVPQILRDELIAHCRQQYPKEACGLLAGANGLVTRVYPMTNVEDSAIGYAMDPKEQLLIEKQMRTRGQQLVGIYHSHTATDAYPSSVDVELAISPEISYVLVSLKDQAQPVMCSYRIQEQTITREDLQVQE